MKPIDLSAAAFPIYAVQHFGNDVQAWGFQRIAPQDYIIWQMPHWGKRRVYARCYAVSAADAKRVFCDMARP